MTLPKLNADDGPRTQTLAYHRGFRAPTSVDTFGPDRAELLQAAAHGARHGDDISTELVEQICCDYEDAVYNLNIADERANRAEADVQLLRKQLAAANGIAGALRERAELTRNALSAEVDAHRNTARRADQEHELRVAAEEEREGVAQLHRRDRKTLAEVIRISSAVSFENSQLRHQIAGTVPVGVQIALDQSARGVTARLNDQLHGLPTDCRFDDSDTEVIDLTMLGGGR